MQIHNWRTIKLFCYGIKGLKQTNLRLMSHKFVSPLGRRSSSLNEITGEFLGNFIHSVIINEIILWVMGYLQGR